jgi:hypothetical protein
MTADEDSPEGGTPRLGQVEAAVVAGLSELQKASSLGTLALLLARRLDEGVEVLYDDAVGPTIVQVSARDTAGLVKELRATLTQLREEIPSAKPGSQVTNIQEKRAQRRGAR